MYISMTSTTQQENTVTALVKNVTKGKKDHSSVLIYTKIDNGIAKIYKKKSDQ